MDLTHVQFCINNPKLDVIALEILRKNNRKLWGDIQKRYFPFRSIQVWDSREIQKLLKQIYLKNQLELSRSRENFKKWWGVIENLWYLFLQDIFELNLRKTIFTAYVGISPIFPRNLETETFLVPLHACKQELLRICAHETYHFYFYRKIKKINFTIQPDKKYLWLTSEILVPLLFSDSRAVNILGQMPQSSYVCKQSFIEKCRRIYKRRSKGEISFQELFNCLLQREIRAEKMNKKFFIL